MLCRIPLSSLQQAYEATTIISFSPWLGYSTYPYVRTAFLEDSYSNACYASTVLECGLYPPIYVNVSSTGYRTFYIHHAPIHVPTRGDPLRTEPWSISEHPLQSAAVQITFRYRYRNSRFHYHLLLLSFHLMLESRLFTSRTCSHSHCENPTWTKTKSILDSAIKVAVWNPASIPKTSKVSPEQENTEKALAALWSTLTKWRKGDGCVLIKKLQSFVMLVSSFHSPGNT